MNCYRYLNLGDQLYLYINGRYSGRYNVTSCINANICTVERVGTGGLYNRYHKIRRNTYHNVVEPIGTYTETYQFRFGSDWDRQVRDIELLEKNLQELVEYVKANDPFGAKFQQVKNEVEYIYTPKKSNDDDCDWDL